ncbi:serine/threonine protein phosphatase 2A 55 kDa regulatory subunit B beta isoform [Gossypium hirsutum]|uniref:Serine/threonine protein phosphatase 2A 55 kDa regulatory subunit B beta isoform n=1 Tax=Gossypium hirsutum TaxID=3635 RepID=A0ABM2ZXN2_GOSHI|nr:serine/threonine protein phosphatase 2A 55 kDa regulatory subunit B beta isoform-like [Gossypium hirsutum]
MEGKLVSCINQMVLLRSLAIQLRARYTWYLYVLHVLLLFSLHLHAIVSFSVDIISAIEFNRNGDHLATDDRGGRVVLFERTDTQDHVGHRRDLEKMDYPINRHPGFHYKTKFQSHEPKFDYLKSLEIEEKINKIRWCQSFNGALFLLSTNDRTIKL